MPEPPAERARGAAIGRPGHRSSRGRPPLSCRPPRRPPCPRRTSPQPTPPSPRPRSRGRLRRLCRPHSALRRPARTARRAPPPPPVHRPVLPLRRRRPRRRRRRGRRTTVTVSPRSSACSTRASPSSGLPRNPASSPDATPDARPGIPSRHRSPPRSAARFRAGTARAAGRPARPAGGSEPVRARRPAVPPLAPPTRSGQSRARRAAASPPLAPAVPPVEGPRFPAVPGAVASRRSARRRHSARAPEPRPRRDARDRRTPQPTAVGASARTTRRRRDRRPRRPRVRRGGGASCCGRHLHCSHGRCGTRGSALRMRRSRRRGGHASSWVASLRPPPRRSMRRAWPRHPNRPARWRPHPPPQQPPPPVPDEVLPTSRRSRGGGVRRRHRAGQTPGRTAPTASCSGSPADSLVVLILIGLFVFGTRLPSMFTATTPVADAERVDHGRRPLRRRRPKPTVIPKPAAAAARRRGTRGRRSAAASASSRSRRRGRRRSPSSTARLRTPAQMVYTNLFSADPAAPYPGATALANQINVLCTKPGVVNLAGRERLPGPPAAGNLPGHRAAVGSTACGRTTASPAAPGGEPITGSVAGPGPQG